MTCKTMRSQKVYRTNYYEAKQIHAQYSYSSVALL